MSVPLQNKLSLQETVLFVPPQAPPVHWSLDVQMLPSLQPVPFGSAAEHVSLASLQDPVQLASLVLSGEQGSPVWPHVPPLHVSVPLQNKPSLHATVLLLPPHTPPVHWSLDVQTLPSLQTVPFGSGAVQLSVSSLQDAAQFESPVLSGVHGLPVALQIPAEQVSVPVQKSPSLQLFVLSFVMTQPVVGFELIDAGLHTSSVQAFPSLQFVLSGVDEHTPVPAAHASSVQDFESLHDATLQQNPPTQAPLAPLVSAHCVFNVHGCPGAFLYERSNVGPFPVVVSRE